MHTVYAGVQNATQLGQFYNSSSLCTQLVFQGMERVATVFAAVSHTHDLEGMAETRLCIIPYT